jgi:F0F1-type ATP synthase membrane subunit b/b'
MPRLEKPIIARRALIEENAALAEELYKEQELLRLDMTHTLEKAKAEAATLRHLAQQKSKAFLTDKLKEQFEVLDQNLEKEKQKIQNWSNELYKNLPYISHEASQTILHLIHDTYGFINKK